MNIVLLRGQVDERTQRYSKIEECNDMWTRLVHEMVSIGNGSGCVMYWGKNRIKEINEKFIEVWRKNFRYYKHNSLDIKADVIIERGGFEEYKYVMKHHKAFKVYYGAGKRYMPERGRYNLILVDSEWQKNNVKLVYPKANVEVFFKPSVDNIFKPDDSEKIYDICYVASIPEDKRKRVKWIYKTCPREYKVLQLGFDPKKLKKPKNFTIERLDRSIMSDYINKCKIGIVPYTKDDSNPRIISEFIACGVPILVMDTVQFWKDKYVNRITGAVASKDKFWRKADKLIAYSNHKAIRDYYEESLSLSRAANYLNGLIRKYI